MNEILEKLYSTLNDVIPGKVSYGTKGISDDRNYIVYQELNNRTIVFADNKAKVKLAVFQVNLITATKNTEIETKLEVTLYYQGYEFDMLSEYVNEDGSINRVYEIKKEVF